MNRKTAATCRRTSPTPAVVGATPVKGAKAESDTVQDKAKTSEPMLVEVETAAEEAARQAAENKDGVIVPIDFDGDSYKRAAVTPVKKMVKPEPDQPAVTGGKAKLFVRTLTMADSEAVLKAYKTTSSGTRTWGSTTWNCP